MAGRADSAEPPGTGRAHRRLQLGAGLRAQRLEPAAPPAGRGPHRDEARRGVGRERYPPRMAGFAGRGTDRAQVCGCYFLYVRLPLCVFRC